MAHYERHRPEETPLYRVVGENLETFLAQARAGDGGGLPRYVEQEFRDYLGCGLLSGGFARVRCRFCKAERLVAFSCKGRAVCPSCNARRMTGTAAFLVDHVLPAVPLRQWVLSVPFDLRLALAKDHHLLDTVLGIFVGSVFDWQKEKALAAGVEDPLCGSVTFIQRFGSSLNLNVHYHLVCFDGVYSPADVGLSFHELPPPSRDDLQAVCERVYRRTLAMLRRRGFLDDSSEHEATALDACRHASTQALLPLQAMVDGELVPAIFDPWEKRFCRRKGQGSDVHGFDLHAGVRVEANDKAAREALVRYCARPPFALHRLREMPDGKLAYQLKKPRDDGTTHLLLTPMQLLQRLSAIIPPPYVHMTRFHGILAPASEYRRWVVPRCELMDCWHEGRRRLAKKPQGEQPTPTQRPSSRIDWAELIKRVHLDDPLVCKCGAQMSFVAMITEREAIDGILKHLNLPNGPPRAKPARSSDESKWDQRQLFDPSTALSAGVA